jgi:hypothetical protein
MYTNMTDRGTITTALVGAGGVVFGIYAFIMIVGYYSYAQFTAIPG